MMDREKKTLPTKGKRTVNQLAMKDVVKNCLIIIPVVIFLMIVLAFLWLFNITGDRYGKYTLWYFYGYLFLIAVSLVEGYIFYKYGKDTEKNENLLYEAQMTYAWVIPVWAVVITMLDAIHGFNNSYNINYVVASVLTISVCYVKVSRWVLIQCVCGVFMIMSYIIEGGSNLGLDCLEILVYILVFVMVGRVIYNCKKLAYEQQELLEEMAIKQEKLANLDGLTGMRNRHSYILDLQELDQTSLPADFTIMAIDINGLKRVNDTYGHQEGDELIKAAADLIDKNFSAYGKVYRMGGDEFSLILDISMDHMKRSCESLDEDMKLWNETHRVSLRMAMGYARREDYPKYLLTELEKVADANMYQDKTAFYQKPGNDRRR